MTEMMPSIAIGRSWTPALRRWSVPLFLTGMLAIWALAARHMPSYLVPGPLAVARSFWEFVRNEHMMREVVVSVMHVFVATVLAFIIGFLLAVAAYYWPVLRLAVYHRLTPFLSSFSGIGWTFVALMWFGVGSLSVIFALTAVLLPFALINIASGLYDLDVEFLEMTHSFTRRRLRGFRFVVLPMLLPFVFASVRAMLGIAWTGALTAELFVGGRGLGHVINLARQEFDTETIFVVVAIVVAIVVVTNRWVLAPLSAIAFKHHEA